MSAYQGLRVPDELVALGARHVRRNTLLVEQRNIDGTLVGDQKLRASIPEVSDAGLEGIPPTSGGGQRGAHGQRAFQRPAVSSPRRSIHSARPNHQAGDLPCWVRMATQATNARHDNAWLRDLLVRALRSRGLRAVCKGEPFTLAGDLADRMSIAVMSALWLGVAASVADWLDATTTGMVLIALLLAGALGVTGVRAGPGRAAIVLVLLWIVALVVQLVHADDDVVETIGVPFVITTGAVAIFHAPRIAAIARSAPLVLAVALTVLVIPLFTNDMWAAVAKLHAGNVFAVAALTLLPTLFLVEKRLRSKVAPTVEAARARMDGTAKDQVQEMLVKVLPDKEREQARNDIARLLPRWWSEADPAEAAAAIIGPLRRRLWRRALLVAVGLVGVSTLYMGLLAWTMIPIDAAEDWVGSPIDVAPVDLFGVRFDVPLGPYVIVSTLFGTLASAVLLASVAVDEDYAQRLAAALLERPVADALMLSAPYLAIREGSTD